MIRTLLLLLLCTISISANSQSLNYAREVVNTLASDEFKGRGYVDDGDKLAAEYIAKQFEEFGLTSYSNNYLQPFDISVNTFPNTLELSINDNPLEAGVNFLIDPSSPSIKGTFDVLYISESDLLSDEKIRELVSLSENKFVVFESTEVDYSAEQQNRIQGLKQAFKYDPRLNLNGVIEITSTKLTWRGSTSVNVRPIFTISKDALPNKIKTLSIDVKNKFYEEYKTQNVIGFLEGTRTDSLIVLMAHYDHLGKMGSTATFNGANDNASGTAMLLSLAAHYSENKPPFSTVFIAFGAEEMGLLGSKYFIDNSPFDIKKTKFFLNFDLAGTGDEGIQVVNGSVYKNEFENLTELNRTSELLPAIKIRGAACNSDHCMFDQKDIPGFYIYTLGGIKAYHDIYDRAETLPLTEFQDYKELIIQFLDQL